MDKKLIFKLLPLALVIFLGGLFFLSKNTLVGENESLGIKNEAQVKIGNIEVTVEIVDTPSELEKGLSGKSFLGANAGMLFKFNGKRMSTFWMKDMLIPIDIIWIKDDTVVGVEANAQPPQENNIPTFTSPEPVNWVLEVNSGFADQFSITNGSSFSIVK